MFFRSTSVRGKHFAITLVVAHLLGMMASSNVHAKASTLDPDWHHGAFMEIFVRSFQDSDGDGVGDLRGLTARLDYLQELGIRGIWLMPIQQSGDNDHGYHTIDYRAIERDYGTLDDFKALIKEAHSRGIGIITDYVINHSAEEHPFFASARSGPGAPYRDWFVWENTAPEGWEIWGKNPWTTTANGAYFGTFGPHAPDFNLRNHEVVKYHFDTMKFWLDLGIDGFRMDAVPHMIENSAKEWQDQPESRAMAKQISNLVHSYPSRYMVCEATADPIAYSKDEVCGSAFAFGWDFPIAKAATGDTEAMEKLAKFFTRAPQSMGTFVSNHDTFAGKRLWDQVEGDETLYRLAAATYLLQPGRPFIYYGEEVGMAGAYALKGDGPLRSPMSWTPVAANAGFTSGAPYRPVAPNLPKYNALEQRWSRDSLFSFYKDILRLRNTLPAIAKGSYDHPTVEGKALHFIRSFKDERLWVVLNYNTEASTVTLRSDRANVTLQRIYPQTAGRLQTSGSTLTLESPAQSVSVYRLR